MLMIFNTILILILISLAQALESCKLLFAKSPPNWEKGLMFVRDLKDFDGMVFLYGDKQMRHFWNKNTYLDLEVYWFSGDRLVGRSFLPSVERAGVVVVSSPEPVDKVVELIRGRRCIYMGKVLGLP